MFISPPINLKPVYVQMILKERIVTIWLTEFNLSSQERRAVNKDLYRGNDFQFKLEAEGYQQ